MNAAEQIAVEETADSAVAGSRAFRALRRWWWVIALAAVLGAVAATLGSAGQISGSAVVVRVIDESVVMASVRTTPGGDTRPLDLRLLARLVADDDAEERLSEALGADVVLTSSTNLDDRTIEIATPTSDEDLAEQVLAAAVQEAQRIHRSLLAETFEPADELIIEQLADVDAQIGTDGAQSDASLAELVRVRAELDARAAAIDSVLDPDSSNVSILTTRTRDDSSSTAQITLALAGAIAAGGMALAAVVLAASLDRRIRTATELEEVTGQRTVLAEVPAEADDVADLVAASAVRHAAAADGIDLVRLVGAAELPPGFDARVQAALTAFEGERMTPATQVVAVGSLASDARAVLASDAQGINVVVVPGGRATRADVERTVAALVRSGQRVAGLLLIEEVGARRS